MFEAIFENDNGKTFVFGPRGNNWFGMNVGSGMDVTLGTSQGFGQIGETVETQAIPGKPIDVTGEFFGPIVSRKNALRNVCCPLASGRLVFQGTHFIRVYVKAAPSFSAVKNNGLFKMQFFAPFPFFSTLDERCFRIGGITPFFRFPVNYSIPHKFGIRDAARFVNVLNTGDVKVPLAMTLRSDDVSTNITVTNLKTLAFLRLNGQLQMGESISIYRDNDNVLRAELHSGGDVTDVLSWIDEDSSLFELAAGDNLISATDDENGAALSVTITFRPAVGALYET